MMKKRLLSILLTLCMLLSVVPMMSISASAESTYPPTCMEGCGEANDIFENGFCYTCGHQICYHNDLLGYISYSDSPVYTHTVFCASCSNSLEIAECVDEDNDGWCDLCGTQLVYPNYVCYIDANENGSFDGSDVKYDTIAKAITAAGTNETTIRLIANVTENVVIAEGQKITLDLNGFVLKASGADENDNSVIKNHGTLTINDSDDTTTHYFVVDADGLWTLDTTKTSGTAFEDLSACPETGDVIAVNGGVITGGTGIKFSEGEINGGGIYSSGDITVNGVAICGNKVVKDGGGVYASVGTATLNSSVICGNHGDIGGGLYSTKGCIQCIDCTVSYNFAGLGGGINIDVKCILTNTKVCCNDASYGGGGIYLNAWDAVLTVNGGEISGNTTGDGEGGGGIFAFMGIVNLNGCTIINNHSNSYAGGIYLGGHPDTDKGILNLSGKVIVSGNTSGTDTVKADNVFLDGCISRPKVTVGATDPLTSSCIGITIYNNHYDEDLGYEVNKNYGQFTENGTNADKKFFFSDNDNYGVKYNENGYLELALIDYSTMPKMNFSANLTLAQNIDIGITVAKNDSSAASITADNLKIYANGEEVTLDSNLEGVLARVEPKDIGTLTYVAVEYDGIILKNFGYSVAKYCATVFNAQGYGADSKLGELCTAILNYGKYAEDYANNTTTSTVNAGHEIDFSKVNLPESKKVFTPNTTYGGTKSGAYLTLESTIKLNYYVESSFAYNNSDTKTQNFFILNQSNKQIDPANVSVNEAENGYIISIDLYAYQLGNEYTLKVKDVDSKVFEITFGVYDYCVYINDNDYSATLKTLCKAIYTYAEAAKAYASK